MEHNGLHELEEDRLRRVVAAKLNQAELMGEFFKFSRHSDLGKSVSTGNSLIAASETSSSDFGSVTNYHCVTAVINHPENSSNVVNNLNHLEMLSQYTRPGVPNSNAQQDLMYREALHAQLQ